MPPLPDAPRKEPPLMSSLAAHPQPEKIPLQVFAEAHDASVAVARQIADLIRERARQNKQVVLGLATGSTPVGIYNELVRLHQVEKLSFKNVVTFNLDEY